jgi:hypothetical protein
MRSQMTRARVDPQNPSAWAECDHCGFWFNLRNLAFQYEWAGTHLYNTGSFRCPKCIDVPQEQLRTIILPPDPPPIYNARVPNFAYEEQTPMIAETPGTSSRAPGQPWGYGPELILCMQDGETPFLMQYRSSS